MVLSGQRRARSVADGRRRGFEHEPPWRRDVGERLGRRVGERDGISGHDGGAAALIECNARVAVQAGGTADRTGAPVEQVGGDRLGDGAPLVVISCRSRCCRQ